MSQERKDERQPAAYHAEVRRRDTGEIIGHLADISAGGCMLTAERCVDPGTRLSLVVELPRQTGRDDSVPVEARVRWCEEDLTPGLFSVGLQFEDDDTGAAHTGQLLQRLLGQGR